MKKIYSFLLLLVSAIVVSLTFYGCGDDDDDDKNSTPTATEIYFEYDEITLKVGETSTPKLYADPDGAAVPSVTWSVDDSEIASISKINGKITANKVGKTYVYATAKTNSDLAAELIVVVTSGSGGGEVSELYVEPYLAWGATETQIKNWEKRTFNKKATLAIDGKTHTLLSFNPTSGGKYEDLIVYALYPAELVFNFIWFNTTTIKSQVQAFLDNKYNYYQTQSDGTRVYIDSDETTAIFFGLDTDGDLYVEYDDILVATGQKEPSQNLNSVINNQNRASELLNIKRHSLGR